MREAGSPAANHNGSVPLLRSPASVDMVSSGTITSASSTTPNGRMPPVRMLLSIGTPTRSV
jgi:hypothetical protein